MIPVLLFLIFICTIYFTIHPFFSDKIKEVEYNTNPEEKVKERQLVNIFNQIQEIEFEYDMGIVAEEDFERTRNELKFEASKILKKSDSAINLINCLKCEYPTNKNDKYCSSCGLNLVKQLCKNCNIELNENDKFCSQCGKEA